MAKYDYVGSTHYYTKRKSHAWIFWVIAGLILLGLAGSSNKKDAASPAPSSEYAQ